MEYKSFKGKEERGEERQYATAFIVCLDDEGHVVIDNSERHFKGGIGREATASDVIHMCTRALHEFQTERTAQIVVKELNRLMKDK